MKLKEILGKDKWNHSKVGNLDVDVADIASGIKTSLPTSSLSVSFQIHFSKIHSIPLPLSRLMSQQYMKTSTGLWEKKKGRKKSTVMHFTDYIPNNILVFCFIIQYLFNKEINISTVF